MVCLTTATIRKPHELVIFADIGIQARLHTLQIAGSDAAGRSHLV